MDYKKKLKDALYSEVVPDGVQEWIEENFPELAESEDEKIRKELLNYLYDVHDDDEDRARWLAWLEKPCEQKSVWSEEDETNLRRTEYAVMKFFGGDCSLVSWMRKSLRPYSQWKPSEEQMDALHYVTNFDYGGHKAALVSLYEQLKKLKG